VTTFFRWRKWISFSVLVLSARLYAQERLTVEQAVQLALQHNRSLQASGAEVVRSHRQYLAAATQQLPQFSFLANGGELLTRPGLSFPAGSLGRLSDGALVPSVDTTVQAARRPGAFVFGQINQPLTQQHRIHLQLQSLSAAQEIAGESRRQSEQDVINQVRRTYYAIVAAESQLRGAEENIRLYRELNRLVDERVMQQVSLKAESLDVRSRLAQAEYEATIPRDGAEDSKEQLNILLGRPIETAFEVEPLQEISWELPDLDAAYQQALANRPEIRVAALEVKRADLARRAKVAEYIPDVSLSLSYLSFINTNSTLVGNSASAGLQVQWEPFDWGRKRHEATEIKEQETEARLRQADTAAHITAQIHGTWRKLRQARELLDVCRLKQDSTREVVRATQIRFEQKAALLRDVLDTQAAKATADDQTRRALAQFWSARADFDRAVGSEKGAN
jgi:outer membrane protein